MAGTRASEAALWSSALDRDPRAFAELFVLHRDPVLRQAMRFVDDRADAEDVAAAAFLELWRRRAAVRVVDGSVRPWLLVTTMHLARNQRRALGRYRAALRTLPRPDPQDVAELAERRIAAGAGDERILRELRHLGDRDAAIASLVLIEGMSAPEAARALGLAPGTVRNRLVRLRRVLRLRYADAVGEGSA